MTKYYSEKDLYKFISPKKVKEYIERELLYPTIEEDGKKFYSERLFKVAKIINKLDSLKYTRISDVVEGLENIPLSYMKVLNLYENGAFDFDKEDGVKVNLQTL